MGTMTRIGDDYLSFIPIGEEKAIRLKGPMFHKDADYKQMREDFQNKDKKKELPPSQFKKNQAKIDRLRNIRVEQFKKQYQQKEKQARRFGPKSMKAKPAQTQQAQPQQSEEATSVEDRQLQDPNVPEAIKEAMIAKQRADIEDSKDQNAQAKKGNKVESEVIKAEQITVKAESKPKTKSQSNSNKSASPPAISSFGQIATGSRVAFFTIQINQVLASKHSLEMQVGSLSMFKLSDIVKKQELVRQIYLLQQQIEVLKAQQEQAATAELIQQQAARYKNNHTTPKPKWV